MKREWGAYIRYIVRLRGVGWSMFCSISVKFRGVLCNTYSILLRNGVVPSTHFQGMEYSLIEANYIVCGVVKYVLAFLIKLSKCFGLPIPILC